MIYFQSQTSNLGRTTPHTPTIRVIQKVFLEFSEYGIPISIQCSYSLRGTQFPFRFYPSGITVYFGSEVYKTYYTISILTDGLVWVVRNPFYRLKSQRYHVVSFIGYISFFNDLYSSLSFYTGSSSLFVNSCLCLVIFRVYNRIFY